jgi:hypothetical protein
MIREYYPEYRDHKTVVISPCIAKRREFDATGLGDYNVTMINLKHYIESQNIDIASCPKVEYTGPAAERAVRFSSPGGLMDTCERHIPGIIRRIHKTEGLHSIYPYLDDLIELLAAGIKTPLLIDCLNCEKGCNGGPGTGNSGKPVVVLENPINERSHEMEVFYKHERGEWVYKKYHKVLNKFWKKDLYNRKYRNMSGNNTVKKPYQDQITEMYQKLKKYNTSDIFNCTACGYGTCEAMAIAMFNGLNKPESCLHYNYSLLEIEKKKMVDLGSQLDNYINHALEIINGINNEVKSLDTRMDMNIQAVNESSEITEKMINDLKNTSDLSRHKQEELEDLIKDTAKGQQSMRETIQSVQEISQSVDAISQAIKIISAIAANTNLLSMNAAIEAAHAGEAGRGFAVVADEIRRLSETTRENSRNISQTLSNIIKGINVAAKQSNDTNSLITKMSTEVNNFANTMNEMINVMGELSMESSSITNALKHVQDHSASVKTGYAEMLDKTGSLYDDMKGLAKAADKNVNGD